MEIAASSLPFHHPDAAFKARALIATSLTTTRAARNSRQPVIGVITHNGPSQRLGINKNAARPIFNLCL
ncbi:MAG: hypothetical protein HQ445_08010 [Polaromonas sp.]|nr:hypothetical protein [Polaromonas sp.]